MQKSASNMSNEVRMPLLHRSGRTGSEDLARQTQRAFLVETVAFETESDATLHPDEHAAGEPRRGAGEEDDVRLPCDPETRRAGPDLHRFHVPRGELLDQVRRAELRQQNRFRLRKKRGDESV